MLILMLPEEKGDILLFKNQNVPLSLSCLIHSGQRTGGTCGTWRGSGGFQTLSKRPWSMRLCWLGSPNRAEMRSVR